MTQNFSLFLIGSLCLGFLTTVTARADNLCPDTTKLAELSVANPGDLQFDIDRLGLCLQRAKLLEQLDESVKKREVIRLQPLGATSTLTVNNANGYPAIPSMPSLPDLPKAQPANNAVRARSPAITSADNGDWKIQRIWGQGADMQAQLAKGETIANVKINDILPDGDKIIELSARGVTLENGKTHHALSWLETTKKYNASTPRREMDDQS